MSRERCCVGAQVTDLCRNVCDSYGDAQPSNTGGDRGDNTARGRCADTGGPYEGCHWTCQGTCTEVPPVPVADNSDGGSDA